MKLFYVLATNNPNVIKFVVKRMDKDEGGDGEVVLKPPPKGCDEYKHS